MGNSPLGLPELVAVVLRYADSKSLVAAAQVNSLWAEEATNYIWRGDYRHWDECFNDPLKALASCTQERRDWYTSKIRYLDLECDDDRPGSTLPTLTRLLKHNSFTFPNLRSVSVDAIYDNIREEEMVKFLSPNLVSLELFGAYFRWSFLEQVKICAPSLQRWSVDYAPPLGFLDGFTAEKFIAFLASMKCLRHLELDIEWWPAVNDEIVKYLLFHPNLEVLSLGSAAMLGAWVIIQAQMEIGPLAYLDIFPRLRFLEVTTEEAALRLILPRLQWLQGISVTLVWPPASQSQYHILDFLSSSSRLEEITFVSKYTTSIPGGVFRRLASTCPLIRKMYIGEFSCGQSDDPVTDELIEKLASSWPGLRIFSLPFGVNLSIKSFTSLARHCQHLSELALHTDICLARLVDAPEELLFPSLRYLDTACLVVTLQSYDDVSNASEQVSRLLDRRFPALQSFRFDLSEASYFAAEFTAVIKTYFERPERRARCPERLRAVSQKLAARLRRPRPGSRYSPFS